MQDKIFDMLLEEEEISWKNILYDLVKTEQMDPWDVNVTLLTQKYIQVIKEMKEHDLRVSGKILLAAAILLKLKSAHLLDKDISRLDALISQTEEEFDELDDEMMYENGARREKDTTPYQLIPRNPQPRKRKVSIHDLVGALQRALATKKKVLARIRPVKYKIPNKKIDIMEAIKDVFHKVIYYSKKDQKKEVTFSRLLPAQANKETKVFTFLPLLHLENHHKLHMRQEAAFEEIYVKLQGKGKAKAK